VKNRAIIYCLIGFSASIAYSLLLSVKDVSAALQSVGLLPFHAEPNVAYFWWPLGRILFWTALGLCAGYFSQPADVRKRQIEWLKRTTVNGIRDSQHIKFWIGLAKFFTPFAIAAGAACLMWQFLAPQKAGALYGVMLAYLLTPIGRLIILGAPAAGLGFWEIIMAIMLVDLLCSIFVVWNFDLILGIPWLGDKLRKAIQTAHDFLFQWKWLQRLTFVGIILFTTIPISGTNAIVATLLGRIIGMDKWSTFIAVSIGAFAGAAAVALPVYGINQLF